MFLHRENHGLGIPAGLAGRVAGGAGAGLKFPPATNPHPQRGLENTRTGFLFAFVNHRSLAIYRLHCHQARHTRTCQPSTSTATTHGLTDSSSPTASRRCNACLPFYHHHPSVISHHLLLLFLIHISLISDMSQPSSSSILQALFDACSPGLQRQNRKFKYPN